MEAGMNMPDCSLRAMLKNAFHVSLACGLMFGQASLASNLQGTKKSTASSKQFRFEALNDKSLKLWEGGQPVLVYNHGVITSQSAPSAQGRSSYFHPVYGLDGEVLTDDFPKDHVNHRGLHWAWPHIKIDGQEVDLWSLRDIRHEFQRWLAQETHSKGAILGVENGWFVGNKRVMLEQVRATVYPASLQGRFIDLELTLTPEGQPISLWGAEGKSYGGLTLRFGPRSKTIVTVPSGRSREDLLITRLPWADLSGDLAGNNDLSGAAVFVHPKHPDYPPTWMTREYGLLAVGWPGITPQWLPAGKTVSLRYRIWVHRGVPEASEIQKAYDIYRNGSKD
jgi:methane monooxygenase PmoA-like